MVGDDVRSLHLAGVSERLLTSSPTIKGVKTKTAGA